MEIRWQSVDANISLRRRRRIFDLAACKRRRRLLIMNYLAHAYLSFHDPALTAGHLIADFVKGKQIGSYPVDIQRGIRLHRELDEFTDKHPATRQARAIFQPSCGPYGGVFMDVVYDHFLATDAERFPGNTLAAFSQSVYRLLEHQYELLPPAFRQMFHYMRQHDWLLHYRDRAGIFNSLAGIVRRAKYFGQPPEVPFGVFTDHYNTLQLCYQQFFPDAEDYMKNRSAFP